VTRPTSRQPEYGPLRYDIIALKPTAGDVGFGSETGVRQPRGVTETLRGDSVQASKPDQDAVSSSTSELLVLVSWL